MGAAPEPKSLALRRGALGELILRFAIAGRRGADCARELAALSASRVSF
jgi:hypothetical protein